MYINTSSNGERTSNFDIEVSPSDARGTANCERNHFQANRMQHEQQNALFVSESIGLRDVQEDHLPPDTRQPASAPAYQNAQLVMKYPEIFERSTVYVSGIDGWKEDDFCKPENRVRIRTIVENAGAFLQALHSELNRPRKIDASLLDRFPDFRDGIEQTIPGLLVPTASESSNANVTLIELKCYVDIFREIAHNVAKFESRSSSSDSSPLHALFFGSRMIDPPFFSDEHRSLEKLEMIADHTTRLRMFIKTSVPPEVYRFTPKDDLAVIDRLSGLPALICEVDSRTEQKGHSGMILEGVVACRQWRYVLPDTLKAKNKVLGLFVDANFSVDLYLFHADDEYNVEIFHDCLFFGRRNDTLRLARILFNYRDKFLDVAGLSEPGKIQQIEKLVSDSKILPSFTTATTEKNVSSGSSRQSSEQPTHATVSETRTDPFLMSEKVQSLLCLDGAYLQATEHESVAAVKSAGIPSRTLGFVKLTNKHEIHAFDAVRNSGSEFLLTRVVLPTKVIEIDEYSVAFLPYGGEPLHQSWGLKDGPAGHETEIAWDLLAIVSRLHELHISHLDIKPANVLWDPSILSIRVIDFDSSEILDPNGSRKIRGIFGTSGFAAPEVESEEDLEYDPFLADAFSCGQVLSDVVMAEKMTEEARFVLEISREFTKEDVNKRWSISKAMQVWTDWLKEHGLPEYDR
ncbi:hypothetical protein ACEPAF_4233 [Sanghuangporus sanghuang]